MLKLTEHTFSLNQALQNRLSTYISPTASNSLFLPVDSVQYNSVPAQPHHNESLKKTTDRDEEKNQKQKKKKARDYSEKKTQFGVTWVSGCLDNSAT